MPFSYALCKIRVQFDNFIPFKRCWQVTVRLSMLKHVKQIDCVLITTGAEISTLI